LAQRLAGLSGVNVKTPVSLLDVPMLGCLIFLLYSQPAVLLYSCIASRTHIFG
jgi:hypothetical protein